jgi:predicted HNH restriction endonuclease
MSKEELQKQIKEQEQENIRLFKTFEYSMHKEESQPAIQEWREGSYKLKSLLKELYAIEDQERLERIAKQQNEKQEKTFINGFGEATNKYITSSTYERAEKRRQKEILSFMGNR